MAQGIYVASGTVEMVDFYEGRVRFGLNIPESRESAPAQILNKTRLLARLTNKYLDHDFRQALQDVMRNQVFLPPGVVMSPGTDLGDSYAVVMPDGCDIRYVGYYESDGTLRISQTMFEKLTPSNQAAFYIVSAPGTCFA